jgi:Mor family transcriptional regulator
MTDHQAQVSEQKRKSLWPRFLQEVSVVSRRHFFFVALDWRHVTGTMMAALGGLRGFVGEWR